MWKDDSNFIFNLIFQNVRKEENYTKDVVYLLMLSVTSHHA